MKKFDFSYLGDKRYLNFRNMFFLFMIGSVIGTISEGIWSVLFCGGWQTHVICMWGPFCIIYGIGMVGFYMMNVLLAKKSIIIKYLLGVFVGTFIELISGLVLEFLMGMRAWNYSHKFLNFRGHICLQMSLLWGLAGIAFILLIKPLNKMFAKMNNRFWNILCIVLTIFMTINLSLTVVAMDRWKGRRENIEAKTSLGNFVDKKYDDSFMENRFIEWSWIDD